MKLQDFDCRIQQVTGVIAQRIPQFDTMKEDYRNLLLSMIGPSTYSPNCKELVVVMSVDGKVYGLDSKFPVKPSEMKISKKAHSTMELRATCWNDMYSARVAALKAKNTYDAAAARVARAEQEWKELTAEFIEDRGISDEETICSDYEIQRQIETALNSLRDIWMTVAQRTVNVTLGGIVVKEAVKAYDCKQLCVAARADGSGVLAPSSSKIYQDCLKSFRESRHLSNPARLKMDTDSIRAAVIDGFELDATGGPEYVRCFKFEYRGCSTQAMVNQVVETLVRWQHKQAI